jgi:hypothetical protein
LETAPDAVVRALAAHHGPLSLGLKSLSVEAARAIAQRQDETILGVQELSDSAANALAKAIGSIALRSLATVSPAGLAALK